MLMKCTEIRIENKLSSMSNSANGCSKYLDLLVWVLYESSLDLQSPHILDSSWRLSKRKVEKKRFVSNILCQEIRNYGQIHLIRIFLGLNIRLHLRNKLDLCSLSNYPRLKYFQQNDFTFWTHILTLLLFANYER